MVKYRVYPEGEPLNPPKNKSKSTLINTANIDPLMKLPNYFQQHSSNRKNGVFVFNQAKPQPAHRGMIGPMGFNLKKYPEGGYPFKGLIGFSIIWNGGKSYITYSEASPETEELWLKESPCSARTLADFFAKLVKVSKTYPDLRIRKLAQYTLKDLGLDDDFLLSLPKRAKGRKLNQIDEHRIAQVINNPKRRFI